MKHLILFLCLFLLLLNGCTNNANAIPFKKVQEKFIKDHQSFLHFLYLGKVHCIGNYFHQLNNSEKYTYYNSAVAISFNNLNAITRLFDENQLKIAFDNFEKEQLTAKINAKNANFDAISFCHSLYENNGKNLYDNFIKNTDNYIISKFKNDNDLKNHHKADMTDYL